MRMTMLWKECAVCFVAVMFLATTAPGQVWESGNLLANPAFDLGLAYWSASPSNGWGISSGGAARRNVYSGTLTQSVSLVAGKRYVAGGTMTTGSAFQGRIDSPIGSTGWLKNNGWTTYSWGPSIYSSGSANVQLRYQLTSDGVGLPVFGQQWIMQVVYPPTLSMGSRNIVTNSDLPGGSTATVNVFLDSSFADDPTSSLVTWGDGSSQSQPGLRMNTAHVYTIETGVSQTWTGTFSGSNVAGSGQDSATITILRQPEIALTVNDAPVVPGSTIDVEVGTLLRLSLLNSEGFIENASFAIPQKLDQESSDLSYSGILFETADIGQVFALTTGVSNTGDGTNSDSLAVNLRIVPEPATLSLLALGGLAILRRKRK